MPLLLNTLLSATVSNDMGQRFLNDSTLSWGERILCHLEPLLDAYAQYPLVVQLSCLITVASLASLVIIFLALLHRLIRFFVSEHFYQKIYQRYHAAFATAIALPENLNVEQFAAQTQYVPKHWSELQIRCWARLYLQLRADVPDANLFNVRTAFFLVGINKAVENNLRYKHSVRTLLFYLQLAEFLHIEVPESTTSRLLNNPSREVRKAVRNHHLMVSVDEPFRILSQDLSSDYRQWDILEFHHIMRERRAIGMMIPSFTPLLEKLREIDFKSRLIQEAGYWGTEEDMCYLRTILRSHEERYRLAAIRAIGVRRWASAENDLKDIFYYQDEATRCAILRTILLIGSGCSVDFLELAFLRSSARGTRRKALYCLYNYDSKGRARFKHLHATADADDKALFSNILNEHL